MKLLSLLFLSSIFILGCSPQQNKPYEEKTLEFYNWYLKDHYYKESMYFNPNFKLDKDSIYQLDTSEYFTKLRSSGYFSKEFLSNWETRFTNCNKNLKTVSYQSVQECGCAPTDGVENCEFTFYDIFLRHQGETTDSITVLESSLNANIAKVKLGILENKKDPNSIIMNLEVKLTKENNNWKISSIQ